MCHVQSRPDTILVGVTPTPLVLKSVHRKRLTITLPEQFNQPVNQQAVFGAAVPISVNLVPGAGQAVLITGIAMHGSVLFQSHINIMEGATLMQVYNFNMPASSPDITFPIGANGYLAGVGQTVNISTTATPAASSTTINIQAELVTATQPRISVSSQQGVVLDSGITIAPGVDPVTLDEYMIGDMITKDLFAVANTPIQVSIIDMIERGPMQGEHPGIDDRYASGNWRFNPNTGVYERGQAATIAY